MGCGFFVMSKTQLTDICNECDRYLWRLLQISETRVAKIWMFFLKIEMFH